MPRWHMHKPRRYGLVVFWRLCCFAEFGMCTCIYSCVSMCLCTRVVDCIAFHLSNVCDWIVLHCLLLCASKLKCCTTYAVMGMPLHDPTNTI